MLICTSLVSFRGLLRRLHWWHWTCPLSPTSSCSQCWKWGSSTYSDRHAGLYRLRSLHFSNISDFMQGLIFAIPSFFIKSQEYKIVKSKLTLLLNILHNCQKNKSEILKSARGASHNFTLISIEESIVTKISNTMNVYI